MNLQIIIILSKEKANASMGGVMGIPFVGNCALGHVAEPLLLVYNLGILLYMAARPQVPH